VNEKLAELQSEKGRDCMTLREREREREARACSVALYFLFILFFSPLVIFTLHYSILYKCRYFLRRVKWGVDARDVEIYIHIFIYMYICKYLFSKIYIYISSICILNYDNAQM